MAPRRVYSKIVYQSGPWRESGELILDEQESVWALYDGPWEECKKGREGIDETANAQLKQGKTDAGVQAGELDPENTDLATLDVKPGQLSSAAQSQLGADLGNINTTYNNEGQVGLKQIAQRGLNGPSGATSSMDNAMLTQRARDENNAYNTAQQTSHADELAAINARSGLQQIYNPNAAYAGAGSDFQKEGEMGSTLGDIGKGLGTVASIGSSVVGMGGLNNIPSAIMNGKPAGCWIAEAIYGTHDSRTHILRSYLNGDFKRSLFGRAVMFFYLTFGQKVAGVVRRSRFVKSIFAPLFDRALVSAIASAHAGVA